MLKKHRKNKIDTQIDMQKKKIQEETTIIRNEVTDDYESIKKNEVTDNYESVKNIIVKGSKLTGDIRLNHDLELHGEVEGNIIAEGESNIIIKGKCRGSIQTEGGNIDIEGHLCGGDIIAGGDIKIIGKFDGGRAEAKGKIFVNGEFNGVLESYDIEIGPNARGKGELYYREFISIAKGAQIEMNIQHCQKKKNDIKKAFQKNVDMELETNTELNSTDRLIKELVKVN